MDLIGEERGRLARMAGWLDASPAEAVGLVVLLVGSLAATAVLVWGALGRPGLDDVHPADGGVAAQVGEAAGGDGDAGAGDVGARGDGAGGADADGAGADGGHGHAGEHGHGSDGEAGHADGDGGQPGAAGVGHEGSVPSGEVTVHVAGAVADAGVVTLPAGARVADAITAAGGLVADADPARVNLARTLVDGEQVLVPREGEELPEPVDPGPPGAGAGVDAAGAGGVADGPGPVNLNTAGTTELETLPGIGPGIAGRIIAHRDQHGPFRTVGDLRDVSGIGEKRFQDLADLVTVG